MNYIVYNELPLFEQNSNNFTDTIKRRKSNGSNTVYISQVHVQQPPKNFLSSLSESNNSIKRKIVTESKATTLQNYNEFQIQTNPFSSLGESSLNKGKLIKFFPEEPVRTKYGKGFVINEFVENNIRFVRIKYRYGYGVVK